MRLQILRVIIYLGFALLVGTLFYHQVVLGEFYRRLSKNNRIRVVPLEARRGSIYDRNGVPLAKSRLSHDVMVIPQDVQNLDDMLQFLGKVLKLDPARLKRAYQNKKLNAFTPIVLVENLTREQVFIIEEERFRFPGLWIEQGYHREYPIGGDSAHVLGYVGKISVSEKAKLKEYGISQMSVVGKDGIEKFYDQDLHGTEGGMQVEVNSRGEQVRFLGVRDPVPGNDITLSIDARLQTVSTDILAGKPGTIIVMDNDSGEILSMVSAPTFDPNDFGDRSKSPIVTGLFANELAPLLNRAVRGLYPPGSVFKVVMAVAALKEGIVSPKETFFCQSSYQLGKRKFGCTHRHGTQNLKASLIHSCNVYYYNIVQRMKVDQIYHYASLFGLGRSTGVDLPFEKDGFVPGPRKKSPRGSDPWVMGDMLNYSIGQGNLLTTPVQMLNVMATVARNGVAVHPHLMLSGGNPDTDFLAEEKIDVPPEIFREIHAGLEGVVEEVSGTAHVLKIEGLKIAGKTGTAQSSDRKENHAWFVGYARGPVRNIAFCVFLEHGGSSYNACVLSKELLLKMRELRLL